MIIDTHSHLNFDAFKDDYGEVIKHCLAENLWLINVGSKYETSQKAVKIAQEYEQGVYAAIGLHPIYAAAEFAKIKTDPDEGEFLIKEQNFDKEKYKELYFHTSKYKSKVVAIGEIGLDYYYKPKTKSKLEQFKEKQKQIFTEQLNFAKELGLPVILHCRSAHSDLIGILKKFQASGFRLQGVIHCFTGTLEDAKNYLDLGLHIGFNGIIFKLNLDEVIKQCPLDKILAETDCPYLTPLPAIALAKVGPKEYIRNEPLFVKYVIQKIAELKGISFEQVAEKTTANSKTLFKI